MIISCTYSPEDNKLRLAATQRFDKETYERIRAAGFIWAPKQQIFVAPMWTPERKDLAIELAGEIGDEDTSLVERAEERAERFEGYRDNRAADAERARDAVAAIADGIPMGQPILVSHHSEKHAGFWIGIDPPPHSGLPRIMVNTGVDKGKWFFSLEEDCLENARRAFVHRPRNSKTPPPRGPRQKINDELLAALEETVCAGCNHRIGWNGEHDAEQTRLGRLDWKTCNHCRNQRAAIAKARA
jgi:Domain of unknown function (DUF3560)